MSYPADDLLSDLTQSLQGNNELLRQLQGQLQYAQNQYAEAKQAIAVLDLKSEQTSKLIDGGDGHQPLAVRLVQIENKLDRLYDAMQALRVAEEQAKGRSSDRFWSAVVNLLPVVLTWLGLAAWTALQIYFKTLPLPPP